MAVCREEMEPSGGVACADTLYIIIGMMITGGVVGYVGKRDNDVNK